SRLFLSRLCKRYWFRRRKFGALEAGARAKRSNDLLRSSGDWENIHCRETFKTHRQWNGRSPRTSTISSCILIRGFHAGNPTADDRGGKFGLSNGSGTVYGVLRGRASVPRSMRTDRR